jgi:hypothetical protein
MGRTMVPASVDRGYILGADLTPHGGVDPSVRLLEGEDPGGIEDARQWLRVYTALVDLKRRRLDRITNDGLDVDQEIAVAMTGGALAAAPIQGQADG